MEETALSRIWEMAYSKRLFVLREQHQDVLF